MHDIKTFPWENCIKRRHISIVKDILLCVRLFVLHASAIVHLTYPIVYFCHMFIVYCVHLIRCLCWKISVVFKTTIFRDENLAQFVEFYELRAYILKMNTAYQCQLFVCNFKFWNSIEKCPFYKFLSDTLLGVDPISRWWDFKSQISQDSVLIPEYYDKCRHNWLMNRAVKSHMYHETCTNVAHMHLIAKSHAIVQLVSFQTYDKWHFSSCSGTHSHCLPEGGLLFQGNN